MSIQQHMFLPCNEKEIALFFDFQKSLSTAVNVKVSITLLALIISFRRMSLTSS